MRRGTASARTLPVLAIGAFAASGCFATRSDVRILQSDVVAVREQAARADSARAAQIAAIAVTMGTLTDSIRAANTRLARWQANTQGDLRSMQEQLLQIQELTGQSQRRLQELRAEMEQRSQSTGTPPVAGDTTRPPGQTQPGPNQLYDIALNQWRRNSHSAARAGFEELLRLYPTSELVPDAQFYIGESYAAEGNAAAADSVYTLVVSRHPQSPRAATALYKHGLALHRANRTREAREAMERVVRDYRSSDEAVLARDWLQTNR